MQRRVAGLQPNRAKRMECVQLAGAFRPPAAHKSESKLLALHTLREAVTGWKAGAVAVEILVADFVGLALLTFGVAFIRPGTAGRARRRPAMGSLAGAEPPGGARSLKQVAAHRL